MKGRIEIYESFEDIVEHITALHFERHLRIKSADVGCGQDHNRLLIGAGGRGFTATGKIENGKCKKEQPRGRSCSHEPVSIVSLSADFHNRM